MIKVGTSYNYEGININSRIEGTPFEILAELSFINATVLKQICREMGQTIDIVLPLYQRALQVTIDNLLAH